MSALCDQPNSSFSNRFPTLLRARWHRGGARRLAVPPNFINEAMQLQSNAVQRKAMQSKAMQSKAKQSKAKQSNAKQCKAKQCKAKQCKAMQCNAMQSKAMQSKAMQSKAMQSKAMQSNAIPNWGRAVLIYFYFSTIQSPQAPIKTK